ncbi:MAG: hypothetical protein RLZZ179_2881 [Verrucomicrobiota bacterium]|jgi:dihydrofolate synthase/folylpolyglutamate synthase
MVMKAKMPAALEWLYSVQQFGVKPGLENTRKLLRELQLPWERQRFFHVAGTNGKGSTCAFLESVLRAGGERTGLFTSPHLVQFGERIRCQGKMIPVDELCRGIESLRLVVSGWDPHPTFFELALMLGLDWFERSGVESVVLETGMGGRLDATNVLRPVVSVITPIGMDHQQWLGGTLAEIAGEKAGIIKAGVPAVSAPQEPEAAAVLVAAAERVGTVLEFVREPWRGVLPLPGEHQAWNAALAVAALRAAGVRLTDEAVREGLAATEWPARFQKLEGGRVIVDGAHNAHGLAALVAAWQREYGDEKAALVYGAVAPRDVRETTALLAPLAGSWECVAPDSPRAMAAGEVVAVIPAGAPVREHGSLGGALAAARSTGRRVLICGSLYLCGEALALLQGGVFESSGQ